MISSKTVPPPDRLPGWPAWATSVVVHAAFFGLAMWLFRDRPIRAAADEPLREAGIVLANSLDSTAAVAQQDKVDESPVAEPMVETTLIPAKAPTETVPQRSSELVELPPLPGVGEERATTASGGAESIGGAGAEPVRRISGKTRVSVFGVEGEGVRFVYLFDRSDSMQGAPIAALKRELVGSLNSLRSVQQFHIIFFNHQVSVWDGGGGRVSFATDENKRLAARFVHGIAATGGTYRKTALRRALAVHPDVIFFLTDTDNRMAEGDVDEAIDRAQRAGIMIMTIEFGVGSGARQENFLKRLARETRGQYIYVDTTNLAQ